MTDELEDIPEVPEDEEMDINPDEEGPKDAAIPAEAL
jgi:hypothetical protein